MRSTSVHSLNADRGLSKPKKLLYLFLNWVNNLFPYAKLDSRVVFKSFGNLPWQKAWDATYPTSSPARKTSDLFWRSFAWDELERTLGEKFHVFDTGCGHGNYAVRIQEGSGERVVSYVGVDAKRRPNWGELEKTYPHFRFIESRSSDILPLIPEETNLFVTQSAIEHFDEDLPFFEQIRTFIRKSRHPVAQIHLFPAAATLSLYLFHGLRQYTPRTISKITRLFDDLCEFSLYPLGGKVSAKLHWQYFTWPVLITRRFEKPTFDVSEYEPLLRQAVEKDSGTPAKSPLFWALVIVPKKS